MTFQSAVAAGNWFPLIAFCVSLLGWSALFAVLLLNSFGAVNIANELARGGMIMLCMVWFLANFITAYKSADQVAR